MSISKIIARNIVLPLAVAFKADKYFLGKTRKTCCILNFHGVRKNNNDVFNNRHMPVSDFDKTINYLKNNFDIVPLSEIFEIYRSGIKPKRKTIALTFDDGYENNFNVALPVLKKYNVPATFYIISKGLTDANYLVWPDALDLIKKRHKEDIKVNEHIFKYPSFYSEELKLDLFNYLKTLGDKSEAITYEIINRFNYNFDEIKTMPELLLLVNGENISKFSNEPLIEFGSHSHTHFNMEFLPKEIAIEELKKSKEIVETKIGKKVITFAFPDGSYLPETVQMAKDLGYKNISAVEYRHNENNSDPNLLARFTISNSTTCESNALRLAKQFDSFGFN